MTLVINDEMREQMKKHPEVRWSNAVRVIIEKKLRDFEIAEKLAQKSKLTEKDVEMLSSKVNNSMGKHAKVLLNESSN